MANLGAITNALVAPVAVVAGVYSDGPSVAQATGVSAGTWYASGTVTVASGGGVSDFIARLWDGTTIIAETVSAQIVGVQPLSLSLSGILVAPAGNLRISVTINAGAATILAASLGGTTIVSVITAMRVA